MKRYLLFDSGCCVCTELAEQIETLSEGKLAVHSLGDPQVQVWRIEALGPNAPWAPTLLAVEGEQVHGWTGFSMAGQLLWLLGPRKSWRVLQLLQQISQPSEIIPNSSRRRFLKSLGGVSLAMFVLSGKKVVFAESEPKKVDEFSEKINQLQISGERAQAAIKQALEHPDSVMLLKKPEGFALQRKEALVLPVYPQDGVHRQDDKAKSKDLAVVLPFKNEKTGDMAFLYFTDVDNQTHSMLGRLTADYSRFTSYKVEYGLVSERRAPESSCTFSCVYNCVASYGCAIPAIVSIIGACVMCSGGAAPACWICGTNVFYCNTILASCAYPCGCVYGVTPRP